MSTELYVIRTALSRGGKWLSYARRWMQSNIPRGDTMCWSDSTPVTIPFCKLEQLALEAAVGAVMEANEEREGPGTAPHRFNKFLDELEKRYPHPNSVDSTRTYESYFLEWLDKEIVNRNAHVPAGWIARSGVGTHPEGKTLVRYRTRDHWHSDGEEPVAAGSLDWSHRDTPQDWEIVAYCVVE